MSLQTRERIPLLFQFYWGLTSSKETAQLLQKLVPAAENVLGHQLETLVEDLSNRSRASAVQEAEHQAYAGKQVKI